MDIPQSMMIQLDESLKGIWEEAVNAACYLRNRLIARICKLECTPFEVVFGSNSIILDLRTFGFTAFVYIHKVIQNGKFDRRVQRGILVGSCTSNSYRILLDNMHTVVEAWDIGFWERPQFMWPEFIRETLIEFAFSNKEIIFDGSAKSKLYVVDES